MRFFVLNQLNIDKMKDLDIINLEAGSFASPDGEKGGGYAC